MFLECLWELYLSLSVMNENLWILWNNFKSSLLQKVIPWECTDYITLQTLDLVQYRWVNYFGCLTVAFCKIVRLLQVLQKNSPFSHKNIKNKFNIFWQKTFYPYPYLSHCVILKLFDSMISFIIYYLCYLFCCWQDTHWIKDAHAPQGSMGKVPSNTLQMSISFQKYWFPSLKLIQVSPDNSDSLLIFLMNEPKELKPWWPLNTFWAGTGCEGRLAKCDMAETYLVTNTTATNLKFSLGCEYFCSFVL